MNITMHRDNVLVLMDWIRDARTEETTPSGLIIARTSRKPANTEAVPATVVASGPGTYIDKFLDMERGTSHVGSGAFWSSEVKAGDRVLIDRADQGDAVVIDGLEHRIVRMHNVIGVIEEEVA